MKKHDELFDPKDNLALVPGIFPANIISITRSVPDKYPDAVTYKIEAKISNKAKDITVPLFRMEDGKRVPVLNELGEQTSGLATFMAGKEFRTIRDVWFHNPSSLKKGESWKNRSYIDLLDALCVSRKIKKDKTDFVALDEMENNDPEILGLPVMVNLKEHSFTSKKDGSTRTLLGIANFLKWENGDKIEIKNEEEDDEKVPF